MLTFQDYIHETFDTPYPWEWVAHEDPPDERWVAQFVTPNMTIRVNFERGMSWWMSFNPTEESMKALGLPPRTMYNILGTGNARQIIATLIEILKDLIKKENPVAIRFSGGGETKGTSRGGTRPDGRTKVYARLTALAPQMLPGWSQIPPNKTNHIFGIKKDGATSW
jgi:hypothetical protein